MIYTNREYRIKSRKLNKKWNRVDWDKTVYIEIKERSMEKFDMIIDNRIKN